MIDFTPLFQAIIGSVLGAIGAYVAIRSDLAELKARMTNAEKTADAKPSFVDVEARPAADVWARHWGLSAGYVTRTPEGLFNTTRLVYPQP